MSFPGLINYGEGWKMGQGSCGIRYGYQPNWKPLVHHSNSSETHLKNRHSFGYQFWAGFTLFPPLRLLWGCSFGHLQAPPLQGQHEACGSNASRLPITSGKEQPMINAFSFALGRMVLRYLLEGASKNPAGVEHIWSTGLATLIRHPCMGFSFLPFK